MNAPQAKLALVVGGCKAHADAAEAEAARLRLDVTRLQAENDSLLRIALALAAQVAEMKSQ
jgi:hypothetical protein